MGLYRLLITYKYSANYFFLPPPVQLKQQLDEEKKVRKIKDEEIQVLKGILSVFLFISRTLINLSNMFTNFVVLFYILIVVK